MYVDLTNICSCCSSSSSSVSSSSGSSVSSGSLGGCCNGTIPTVLHATFLDNGGCAVLNGATFELTNFFGFWEFTGTFPAPCGSPTGGGFFCETGQFTIVFGADNLGGGLPLTYQCDPFIATYTFNMVFTAGPTCCVGTVSVILTA